MSFEVDETSIEDSQPREYMTISYGVTTYNIAFGSRELVFGSVIYTPVPSARGSLQPAGVGRATEMTFTLPVSHPLVARYLQLATPPKVITATISRLQVTSGETEGVWISGHVTSMKVDDDCTEATFRIASRVGEQLQRHLPTITTGRTCPLVLYSTRCGVLRSGTAPIGFPYQATTTVITVDGTKVRVDLPTIAGSPLSSTDWVSRADWFVGGEFTHVASGEIMTIRSQTDLSPGTSTLADVSLQAPIVGMVAGDSVVVQAGCKRDIVTCSTKFSNKQNFGGFPQLPQSNPFVPQSWGVIK